MAILEITATEVVQHCAKCGRENRLPLAGLEVGISIHGVPAAELAPDPRPIQLPPCPTCKSQEFLIRSEEGEPEHRAPGSFGHLHRLLVDHLHSELVKANKVSQHLRDQQGRVDPKIAKPLKQADRDKFFGRGLKIERFPGGTKPEPTPQ